MLVSDKQCFGMTTVEEKPYVTGKLSLKRLVSVLLGPRVVKMQKNH